MTSQLSELCDILSEAGMVAQFWYCPLGHSAGKPGDGRVTVTWSSEVATCTQCGWRSDQVVDDDPDKTLNQAIEQLGFEVIRANECTTRRSLVWNNETVFEGTANDVWLWLRLRGLIR